MIWSGGRPGVESVDGMAAVRADGSFCGSARFSHREVMRIFILINIILATLI